MDYKIKGLSDHTEEGLLNELRRVAKLLNKNSMTKKDFRNLGKVSPSTIENRFGTWNAALKKAGLTTTSLKNISNEELFTEIENVWNRLGRQPKYDEMNKLGKFSTTPYEKRFGSWLKALEEFAIWKGRNETDTFKDLNEISSEILQDQQKRYIKPRQAKKTEYGEPVDFLGLRHAPLNEQGVVYLFGMLSRQLGFIIEAVRTDFPDCEGKRQIPDKPGRWERVSIEFEYKSSHFKDHGHDLNLCDVIVCWEDDWKDCPIEIISLKEIMNKVKKQK